MARGADPPASPPSPRPLIRHCDRSLCRAESGERASFRSCVGEEEACEESRSASTSPRTSTGSGRSIAATARAARPPRRQRRRGASAALIDELQPRCASTGRLTVGIDVVGGIASLLTAMLLDAGIDVVHVPGLAVNRARQGTTGGEHKSDPRDAAVIADQVRHRSDLRPIEPTSELDAEIRLLVGRRRELVTDQTRRISRLRDLLAVDPSRPGARRRSDHQGRPAAARPLRHPGRDPPRRPPPAGRAHPRAPAASAAAHVEELADAALAAAHEQTIAVPGERVAAELVRELAAEAARRPRPAVRRSTATSRPRSSATLTRPSSAACRGWGPR